MLFAMYREQQPHMSPAAIAETVLKQHLHGVDIDPRRRCGRLDAGAAGVGDNQQRAATAADAQSRRHAHAGPRQPRPPPQEPPQRGPRPSAPCWRPSSPCSSRRPSSAAWSSRMRAIGGGAETGAQGEQGRPVGAAGRQRRGQPADRGAAHAPRPEELKRQLLERIERCLPREAQEGNAGAQLLGHEAGEGLHLLQLLDRKYAVVATNPPYMGSKNMDAPLREYVERHYKPGKRDLYAAFILRCLELASPGGRVAAMLIAPATVAPSA